MNLNQKFLICLLILGIFGFISGNSSSFSCHNASDNSSCTSLEEQAKKYLIDLNPKLLEKRNEEYECKYQYNINVTEENQKKMNDVITKNAQFFKDIAEDILLQKFNEAKGEWTSRQIKRLSKLGYNALPENEYNQLLSAISRMQTNYAKVKVCEYNNPDNCGLSLEPDIEYKVRKSRDPEELKYYWKTFYDKAGTPVKNDFLKYIEISRKAAKLNNFTSMAEDWIDEYEDEDFEKNLEEAYNSILPLYKQIHAYVRYRLRKYYGAEIVSDKGNLPIHILGNLWGQTWHPIIDLLTPYPDKPFFDVTDELIEQGYTPVKIFEMGDDFFQSINMKKLPDGFWEKSVLEKPSDGRNIICHASAWDFFKIDDVRIKQCTKVNMEHLYIAHHELGHIQYYLQYQYQPEPFRGAPNPGFHEAVGDVIALSVSTPKHLTKIGLLKNFKYDEESRINELFVTALKKVVFLPFAYTLDKYRYAVFRNEVHENELNCEFWKMRSKFGGIEPPVERSENDFDPTAKYHLDADVEYLRYFAAHIFQFQFHKTLCEKSGQYVKGDSELTLDNCDIYGSKEAGNAFKSMLELGASKHWKDALEIMSGERSMTASAILEYFEPLQKWLETENAKMNIPIGWEITDKCK
ncbi:angiotensin-converting enzyme-like [Condylostylus longicornis]|uniref:angiotensin-converting enzyme-like n=1 Tax=Condylostylus longicornis TaxID=2530218 RepID=UPI00244D9E6F|nr:angiotensin-converting enzyme-like [Condylostylus longicornis]